MVHAGGVETTARVDFFVNKSASHQTGGFTQLMRRILSIGIVFLSLVRCTLSSGGYNFATIL